MGSLARRILVGAVLAALVFGAVGAYAYWTTGGSGAGSATAGTTTNNLTIASGAVTGITPGSSTPVTVTITNPNSYSVHVDTVSTVITTSDPGCLPADFTFPAKVLNTTIAALGTASFTQNLVFADTAANQDLCKGATITLTYTSN
jgi:chorismate synthase